MRSMRPLTHLLNVCMDSFCSYCYCMTTVFIQSHFDCGMEVIAQIQVKVFFCFLIINTILHIFFQMCHSIVVFMKYQVVYFSIHHLYMIVLMLMTMMILLEVNLNDQL